MFCFFAWSQQHSSSLRCQWPYFLKDIFLAWHLLSRKSIAFNSRCFPVTISGRSLYVGETLEVDQDTGRVKIDVKNRFSVGDKLEVIEPSGNRDITLESMWNMQGEPISVAPGSGHFVWIQLNLKSKKAHIARYTQDAAPMESTASCSSGESCCNA